jgi:hypothetical protein
VGKDSFPQLRVAVGGPAALPFRQLLTRPAEPMRVRQGGCRMALVIGLVSIAVIWVVVIYGSIYVNKNVQ